MPCYHPLQGFRSRQVGGNGKRAVVFNVNDGYADRPVNLPCGQCIGCRLERSRQWAVRCTHEASLYEDNCFITLTYDDEHLPPGRSLRLRDFQLFMKNLRKRYGKGIRFFHCGEYGEKFGRPHYHACLFNMDFKDRKLWKVQNGYPLDTSEELSAVWSLGFSSVGEVTFQSAAYVARYVTKKVTGDRADEHYRWVDPQTGEVFDRTPEYTTMSRRPGIGIPWLQKWRTDVYPMDKVILNGRSCGKPPRAYDKSFEETDPRTFARIRGKRVVGGRLRANDNTTDRLKVREQVQRARLELLPRTLDKE